MITIWQKTTDLIDLQCTIQNYPKQLNFRIRWKNVLPCTIL